MSTNIVFHENKFPFLHPNHTFDSCDYVSPPFPVVSNLQDLDVSDDSTPHQRTTSRQAKDVSSPSGNVYVPSSPKRSHRHRTQPLRMTDFVINQTFVSYCPLLPPLNFMLLTQTFLRNYLIFQRHTLTLKPTSYHSGSKLWRQN